MMKKSILIIIIGIVLIIYGFVLKNNKNTITCTRTNSYYTIEIKYEMDSNGKVLLYTFRTITDYSEATDAEFEETCKDIDDQYATKDGILDTKSYCDLSNKKFYDISNYHYDKMPNNARKMTLYKDRFEYIFEDGTLNEEQFIKDMKKDNYTCE